MKNIKNATICTGVIFVLAGLVLLIYPEVTARTIAYAVALISELMGILYITSYFRTQPSLDGMNKGLVVGLIAMMFGIFVFVKDEIIISVIPILLGFLVATSGLNTLQQGIDLARVNASGWGVVILISVVNIVIGVVAICNPFSTATVLLRIIGAGFVYSGATDIIISIYLSSRIKKFFEQADERMSEVVAEEVVYEETVDEDDIN